MNRDHALARLRTAETGLRQQGVSALYLFGSVARGDPSSNSDVDLAFDVPPDVRFSLFDQARIQTDLADLLKATVDFIPLEALRSTARKRVEADMVRVF